MRGLAVLLLVSFHVIGATSDAGLQLDYPHPLRVFADLLIDLRMPDRIVLRLSEEAAAARAETLKKNLTRCKGVDT